MTDSLPGFDAGARNDWPFNRAGGAQPSQSPAPLLRPPQPSLATITPAQPEPAAQSSASAAPAVVRVPSGWPAGALPVPPAPAPAAPERSAAQEPEPDAPPTAGDLERSTPAPGERAEVSRRRTIVIAAAVTGVVVVGVGVAALSGAFSGSDPVAVPSPSTVTLASPTPTLAPVARQPLTPFADALPATVLSYALTGITDYAPLAAAGALEGHQLDYSDGGSGALTLYAGQFESAAAATAVSTAILAAPGPGPAATPPSPVAASSSSASASPSSAAPPASGPVQVGGQPAGTWTRSAAANGAGVVTWTNGSALFQAVGPAGVVMSFYEAFPQ